MQLETVNIEDVFPNPNNPRQKFENLDVLIDQFSVNGGQPYDPLLLLRDGGIYWIVDGERRYRALKKIKAKSFRAIVVDDMDEAEVLLAMMATDTKQPLTELEKSRGVQQMILHNIDPVKIEKVVRRSTKKIKKAMGMVQDAAADMTLDRLLVIQEFEGDPKAVEELTNCTERDWERVAKRLRADRKRKADYSKLRREIEERGWTIVEAPPYKEGYRYRTYVESGQLDFLAKRYEKDIESGAVFYLHEHDIERKAHAEMFVKNSKREAEEAQRKKKLDGISNDLCNSSASRRDWVAQMVSSGNPLPRLRQVIRDHFAKEYPLLNEYRIDRPLCDTAMIVGYLSLPDLSSVRAANVLDGTCPSDFSYESFHGEWRTVEALLADGYEPEFEYEAELYEKCKQVKPPSKEE